jgi:hypothetical protein
MSKFARRTGRWLTRLRRRFYLLNDTFTTNLAAGSVNGTDAEPGPGTRAVVDTNSKLALVGGEASFATGGAAANDPALRITPIIQRAPGRTVVGSFSISAAGLDIGWDANLTGSPSDSVRANGTTLQVRQNNTTTLSVGVIVLGTPYQIAVVWREVGALYFIKGGTFTNWTLIAIGSVGNYAEGYMVASAVGTTSVGVVQYLRSPDVFWLPAPLLSDGFGSTFGTSDGLGHAEGVAMGRGRGGDGLAYTQVGTWATATGAVACTVLAGGLGITHATLPTADVIATVKVTRAGGVGGLALRYVDANNYITCHHDGTNVLLVKKVAGVDTTVQTTVVTYVAGAELRVIATGTAFRVYYNNAIVGTEQAIADAALLSPLKFGLYSTNVGNTFDDLAIYARGTGGEYAALDAV